jgi:hypothetical protein
MATAEHAITVNEAMELPALPPNQGVEAMKDIVFGSVSSTVYQHCWATWHSAALPATPALDHSGK